MPLIILPNQAIGSLGTNPDVCGGEYLLPCQRGDVYTLQGQLTPTFGEDRAYGQLLNSKWTLGAGFSQSDGNILNYNGSDGSPASAVSSVLNMRANHAYLIHLTVNVSFFGTCTPGQGIQLNINGDYITLPGAVNPTDGVSNSFSFAGFYIPASINTDEIEITFNNATIQFQVSDIFMVEYSYPLIEAFDTDGNFIQSIDPDYIKYFNYPVANSNINAGNPEEFPFILFDIQFGLDQLQDGCYYLKIRDGAGNIANGNFLNNSTWTVGSGWAISDGVASFAGIPLSNALSTPIYLEDNPTPYTLRFYMPSGTGALQVSLILPNTGGFVQSFTGVGWHTFQFNIGGGNQGPGTLSFTPLIGIGNVNISFTNVTMDFDDDFTSENISLKTFWPVTLLFSATNNDGAFGFDYSNGLTHRMRLKAKQDVTSYPEVSEIYTYSDNSEALLFGQTQKEYTIFITDAPVYVHDCLRHLRLHDTFMIDGKQYVKDGSYDLNRRKTSSLKQSSFTVRDVAGISSNYRLS